MYKNIYFSTVYSGEKNHTHEKHPTATNKE